MFELEGIALKLVELELGGRGNNYDDDLTIALYEQYLDRVYSSYNKHSSTE